MAPKPIRHLFASLILSLGDLLSRATGRHLLYAAATVGAVLFLATVVFGADEFTGLSGQPIQRATTW